MSPNKRKPGKKKANLWLTEDEHSALSIAAKKAGMNKSDFIKWAIGLNGINNGENNGKNKN